MHKAPVSTHLPDSKSLLLNICESTEYTQLEMHQFAEKKKNTDTPGMQSPKQNNHLGNMMGQDVNQFIHAVLSSSLSPLSLYNHYIRA